MAKEGARQSVRMLARKGLCFCFSGVILSALWRGLVKHKENIQRIAFILVRSVFLPGTGINRAFQLPYGRAASGDVDARERGYVGSRLSILPLAALHDEACGVSPMRVKIGDL